ncbi:DUF916 and DUF3324 domain-containing protein [Vagococcus zengguangii]|nr:DUF916 and DUF3324 domain-containing protein [Vagococcus zengguangii]
MILVVSALPISHVQASEFNFAVTTIPSENQLDTRNTYFDLLLKPNQEDNLKVSLRNDTNQDVTVDVSVNSATTNSNLVVEYGKNNIEKDASLSIPIETLVDYPEEVLLKAHSEQIVEFKVKMTEEAFKGVLAGGITFKEREEETAVNDDAKGLSIKNEYSYVVALLMRQNKEEVMPNLNLISVVPDQINARNVITANIQNDQKAYINRVYVETKITKAGSDQVLYQETKERGQIAPNTTFKFPTPLNGEKLAGGKYHITIDVYGNEASDGKFSRKSEDQVITYQNHWQLSGDFEIASEVAKELNSKDVSIKKDYTWLFVLIGALLLLLVLLLILWLVRRKKKNEQEAG